MPEFYFAWETIYHRSDDGKYFATDILSMNGVEIERVHECHPEKKFQHDSTMLLYSLRREALRAAVDHAFENIKRQADALIQFRNKERAEHADE